MKENEEDREGETEWSQNDRQANGHGESKRQRPPKGALLTRSNFRFLDPQKGRRCTAQQVLTKSKLHKATITVGATLPPCTPHTEQPSAPVCHSHACRLGLVNIRLCQQRMFRVAR